MFPGLLHENCLMTGNIELGVLNLRFRTVVLKRGNSGDVLLWDLHKVSCAT